MGTFVGTSSSNSWLYLRFDASSAPKTPGLGARSRLRFYLLPSLQMLSARAAASKKRAAGALDHPNVVTVYDIGDYEGRPLLARRSGASATCAEG